MPYEHILLERDKADRRIAWLTLNRPDRMNALSEALMEEVFDALDRVDQDSDAVALIIKGAGRTFTAGYDIALPAAGEGEMESPVARLGAARRLLEATTERYLKLWRLRKPTIAQVHGYCLSGGTEFIAMCDIVIAASDAKFAHIAGRDIGTLRTNGLYPFYMGLRRTKEYLFTGDFIDGTTAATWGLINSAVSRNLLEEEVYEMARRIVRIPVEVLSYHKAVSNAYYETLGMHEYLQQSIAVAVLASAECGTPVFEKIMQDGLNETIAARDRAWKEHQRVKLHGKEAEKTPW